LGFIGILHTWGKSLCYHPHIHYIISGGGLSEDKWIRLPYQRKFIFPSPAISRTIRGRFVKLLKQAYAADMLVFPRELKQISSILSFNRFCYALGNKSWYCHAKKPFSGPEKVLEYMGRYTHRVAISNSRLISIDGNRIVFRGKDYKDNGKQKIFTLDAATFIQRFLWHVLPKGFRKIRHFGFLNSGARSENIKRIRSYLEEAAASIEVKIQQWLDRMDVFLNHRCPKCKTGKIAIYLDSS